MTTENEEVFMDVLKSGGYESAVPKEKVVEIVAQCLMKRGW